nr:hypothetical protein Iba_chr10cCG1070 [Ipomoea batatas]
MNSLKTKEDQPNTDDDPKNDESNGESEASDDEIEYPNHVIYQPNISRSSENSKDVSTEPNPSENHNEVNDPALRESSPEWVDQDLIPRRAPSSSPSPPVHVLEWAWDSDEDSHKYSPPPRSLPHQANHDPDYIWYLNEILDEFDTSDGTISPPTELSIYGDVPGYCPLARTRNQFPFHFYPILSISVVFKKIKTSPSIIAKLSSSSMASSSETSSRTSSHNQPPPPKTASTPKRKKTQVESTYTLPEVIPRPCKDDQLKEATESLPEEAQPNEPLPKEKSKPTKKKKQNVSESSKAVESSGAAKLSTETEPSKVDRAPDTAEPSRNVEQSRVTDSSKTAEPLKVAVETSKAIEPSKVAKPFKAPKEKTDQSETRKRKGKQIKRPKKKTKLSHPETTKMETMIDEVQQKSFPQISVNAAAGLPICDVENEEAEVEVPLSRSRRMTRSSSEPSVAKPPSLPTEDEGCLAIIPYAQTAQPAPESSTETQIEESSEDNADGTRTEAMPEHMRQQILTTLDPSVATLVLMNYEAFRRSFPSSSIRIEEVFDSPPVDEPQTEGVENIDMDEELAFQLATEDYAETVDIENQFSDEVDLTFGKDPTRTNVHDAERLAKVYNFSHFQSSARDNRPGVKSSKVNDISEDESRSNPEETCVDNVPPTRNEDDDKDDDNLPRAGRDNKNDHSE